MARIRLEEERERALEEVAPVDPKAAKGGKDAKGGKGGDGVPEPTEVDMLDAADDDLARSLMNEENLLHQKMKRIQQVCERVTNDMKKYSKSFFFKLNKRASQRFAEERAALHAMQGYVAGEIEAERPLSLLVGFHNTKSTVVQRQNPIEKEERKLIIKP